MPSRSEVDAWHANPNPGPDPRGPHASMNSYYCYAQQKWILLKERPQAIVVCLPRTGFNKEANPDKDGVKFTVAMTG